MKHYSILLLIIISVNVCFSQQDPQYTQYMYNTQVVNPGYIGSKNALGLGLLYRTQWAGFEGAPNTGTFTFNMPLGALKRNAIGLSIINDEIGPSNETGITIDYAYSLILSGRSRISFGITVLSEPLVAFKRVVVISMPASMGAIVVDSFDKE